MDQKCDYDCQAEKWLRAEATQTADFFGRPELIRKIKVLGKDKDLIDAGCGEGYIARIVRAYAKSVTGFDLSKEMIKLAEQKEKQNPQGIDYFVGNIRRIPQIPDNSCDLYYSSLVFHYLKPEELIEAYSEVNRVLRNRGNFLIMIAHPKGIEALTRSPKKSAWLVEKKSFDYEKSKGEFFDIRIRDLKGRVLHVAHYHSKLEDHQEAIEKAGLKFKGINELTITDKIARRFPLLDDRVGESIWAIIKGKK